MVTYHELASIKELQKGLKTIYFGTAINHEKKKKKKDMYLALLSLIAARVNVQYGKNG